MGRVNQVMGKFTCHSTHTHIYIYIYIEEKKPYSIYIFYIHIVAGDQPREFRNRVFHNVVNKIKVKGEQARTGIQHHVSRQTPKKAIPRLSHEMQGSQQRLIFRPQT